MAPGSCCLYGWLKEVPCWLEPSDGLPDHLVCWHYPLLLLLLLLLDGKGCCLHVLLLQHLLLLLLVVGSEGSRSLVCHQRPDSLPHASIG
jgi:hypothetical protein